MDNDFSELESALKFAQWAYERRVAMSLADCWVNLELDKTIRRLPLPTPPAGSKGPHFERSASGAGAAV